MSDVFVGIPPTYDVPANAAQGRESNPELNLMTLAPANARDVRIQIISISADSPAAAAGLQPGDAIVSLDGQAANTLEQVQGYTASHAGQPIALGVRRNGEQLDLTLTPQQLPESEGRAVVGVSLAVVGRVAVPWWRAPWEGVSAAWSLVVAILVGLGGIIAKLFSGGGPVDVAGPIGVAVLTGQAVQLGWLYVLQFVAVLSINLAVINLLPLPALDGGRLAVLGIEAVSRRSLPEKLEQNLHRFGFGALIALLILVTVVDARRFGAGIWNAFIGLFS
jgi:regulator of sigma E protease